MSKIYVDEIAGIVSADTVAIPGHVIQVVSLSGSTQASVSTDTITRVGDTVSITPKSSSSKIVVTASATLRWSNGDAGVTALHRQIDSGSWSEIKTFSRHTMYRNFETANTAGQFVSFTYEDSPSTTGVVTYSWAMNRFTSGTAKFNPNGDTNDTLNWVLMEIAG